MKPRMPLVALAAALLAACNAQQPYRDAKSNPRGSPAERTGGARPDQPSQQR